MKAHFKRSMKEYEARYLKEKLKETEQKVEEGAKHLDASKDMYKLTYSQEDTRMGLSSTLASSSINNHAKNRKTLTKRSMSLNKKTRIMHSSENISNSSTYSPSSSPKDYVVKQEGVDMEDNNNDLIIDESASLIDEKGTERDLKDIESEQNTAESNADEITKRYCNDINNVAKEEDIVVDDNFDNQEEAFVSSKRRRIPSDNSSISSRNESIKIYRNSDFKNNFSSNRVLENYSVGEDCSENEEENINNPGDRFQDGQDCDSSIEEELNTKCNWCQRSGPCSIKMHVSEETELERTKEERNDTLGNEYSRQNKKSGQKKGFCNERCFSLYRRAAFKKNRRCEWCRRPSKQPLTVKDNKHRYFCRYVITEHEKMPVPNEYNQVLLFTA